RRFGGETGEDLPLGARTGRRSASAGRALDALIRRGRRGLTLTAPVEVPQPGGEPWPVAHAPRGAASPPRPRVPRRGFARLVALADDERLAGDDPDAPGVAALESAAAPRAGGFDDVAVGVEGEGAAEVSGHGGGPAGGPGGDLVAVGPAQDGGD